MSFRTQYFMLIIAICIVILIGGCHVFDIFPYDRVPIDLSKAGSVSTTLIKINRSDRYKFSLAFKFERGGKKYLQDIPGYAKLCTFLGGYYKTHPGTVIPIKLSINRVNGKTQILYHEEIYDTKGSDRSDDNAVYRQITIIHLKPGKYAIRLESLKDFPDMPKATVTLEVLRFFAK